MSKNPFSRGIFAQQHMLRLAVTASSLILLEPLARLLIYSTISVGAFLVLLIVWVLFFITLLLALYRGIMGIKDKQPRKIVPVIVCLIAFGYFYSQPMTYYGTGFTFKVTQGARANVIEGIQSGTLPVEEGFASLPSKYFFITSTGKVDVSNKKGLEVFFPEGFAILDGHGGYLYRENANKGAPSEFKGRELYAQQLAPHWWAVIFP